MPPQSQPPQSNNLDPNQVSVGLAQTNNFLSQHLQSQMPQEQPNTQPAQDPAQGAPSNQTNQTDVKAEMQGLETRLMDELQTLKAEMKSQGDGKAELADLKKQIETILASTD